MPLRSYFQVIIILLLANSIHAQILDSTDLRATYQYHIYQVKDEIKIDGRLDEITWSQTEIGADFWQKSPYFEAHADPKTEIMLAYNDDFLYVAARCFQKEKITITSLKRDVYWSNDGIAIILDPLNTKTNSTMFGSSAVGVQWDATMSPNSDVSEDWSNKWFVETQVNEDGWTVEFAIPFKILRYNQNFNEWGLNFVRNLPFANEYHNWTAVPEGFWPPNSAFAGSLIWDQIPSKKKGNYNLIPYVSGGVRKVKDEEVKVDYDLGLDAKIAVTSTLNLDLTINPDFSQIEVDELVTNLTRFNIFLPEKRTFFLESADVFANFGTGEVKPFFSRRIGLNNNSEAVPIVYGARLTGNVSNDLRVGVMNVQSATVDESNGQNQSAIAAKKQFGRSYVQGMILNRQGFQGADLINSDYSRNLSLEGLFQSDDGQWQLWSSAHGSLKENLTNNNLVFNTGVKFRNANWAYAADFTNFQENYYADMGFTARVNNYDAERDTTIRVPYKASYSFLQYQFRPKSGYIQNHRFSSETILYNNLDWSLNELTSKLRYNLSTTSTSNLNLSIDYNKLDLLFPFSFTGDTPLPSQSYQFVNGRLAFSSDGRRALSYNASIRYGGFYNGTITSLSFGANYRVQPWGNLSFAYERNQLNLPDDYRKSNIVALLSKLEIGFTKNLLWTSLFQYVDQSNFVGFNSRLQWRFSPMSDIYLVYIDNYRYDTISPTGSEFNSENRALVMKFNYWY